MLKLKKYNFFKIKNKFNFIFLKSLNLIYLYTKIGYMKIFMPSIFFFKNNKFIFNDKTKYLNILKQFLFYFNKCFKFYFFKIRLRGLGYKVEKFSLNLYKFFFAYNHYFYFHVPQNIFVKNRKRTIIIFSNKLEKLNDVFSNLLLLKKLDLYERTNTFVVSRQIKFFKKRK